MKIHKHSTTMFIGLMVMGLMISNGEARSFKARYYKDCYAQVKEVEPLLKEKGGVGGTMQTAAKAGGLFGRVGGFVGLGSLGSTANTAAKVSKTVNTINKYSTVISDASAFMSQMKQDHPNSNDRFNAYGDKMIQDADDLNKVQGAIQHSQECYDDAYDELGEKVASKEMSKKKAKKRLKEIQKGTKASGKKLLTTMKRINTNIESYDKTLGQEQNTLGLNLGSLGSLSGVSIPGDNNSIRKAAAKQGNASRLASFGNLSSFAGLAGARPGVGAYTAAAVAGNLTAQTATPQAELTETEKAAQEMLPGLQKAGLSSQKYLDLYDDVSERVEDQEILETKVKKRPW